MSVRTISPQLTFRSGISSGSANRQCQQFLRIASKIPEARHNEVLALRTTISRRLDQPTKEPFYRDHVITTFIPARPQDSFLRRASVAIQNYWKNESTDLVPLTRRSLNKLCRHSDDPNFELTKKMALNYSNREGAKPLTLGDIANPKRSTAANNT